MPRDIPIGNGRLLITFDQDYCLRDIYFPHPGKEDHTDGHKFRFGIWVDGSFEWITKEWNLRLDYSSNTLITHVTALNERLRISLYCNDLVDYKEDIYIKKIIIKNLIERERNVRLFFHHDFHILETPTGDTAYYDPDERAIIHYKADRYFLISGLRGGRRGIDEYATGIKEFHGLEGTWRDAEDGRLEGAPISQGSVDSTISFRVDLPPAGEHVLYYWICAGRDYADVNRLNRMISGHGIEYFIKRTENYWKAWVNKEDIDLSALPEDIASLFKRSLMILRTNIDSGGAIIAGNDSDVQHFARDTYSYMWPRDGALVAYALDLAGYHGITRRFFEFCHRIIKRGKESVGYFLHKYNPDGSLGSSWHPWIRDGAKQLPIQEDGTGLILWSLWYHFDRYRDIEFISELYDDLVIKCGDFLASYRDSETGLPLPSYDLWEEKWGIHTFTVSAVYGGLKAAEHFSVFFRDQKRAGIYSKAREEIKSAMERYLYDDKEKRFLKSLIPENSSYRPDMTIDASIYAPFYFGVFEPDDEKVINTMNAIKEHLWVKTDVGGIARYTGDSYHRVTEDIKSVPGNPWFICTLWLAQWYIAKAKNRDELKEAIPILEWVTSRALPSGVLAEQVHPFTNQPLSVSPLTWSHAAFAATVLEYLYKLEKVYVCPTCGMPLQRIRG
ncbi:glucan 1,3-alpha-glucosidase [Dissulfurispira thermophila]|uniref:Glucan 1,3-alpha-glucosidase n=1 Tax=Dissulfurispira thermophila TaxID=2715679 RepID=A0A7G1H099_9BACT|nr:glycoside hydrolase family 15 protein [Dissulfurispira thermophila]BCB95583.1 glucan 1,3-alpha-glucosidase [Dissulfurispira thermophila]